MKEPETRKELEPPKAPGENREPESRRDARIRHYWVQVLLCAVPMVIILLLGGVLAKRFSEGGGENPGTRAGMPAAEADISVRQKSAESMIPLKTEHKVDFETIEDGLRDMGFLITEEYYFTELLSDKKVSTLFGAELWGTEESYMVTYDGVVEAGIDFGAITVRADESGEAFVIRLPEAVMREPNIDPASLVVRDEKHSIFNKFTEEERGKALERLEEEVRKKAEEKGILEKAEKNARQVISTFVGSIAGPGARITFEKGE